MNESSEPPVAPPRLLLGVSLLFWGAVIEQPLTGLLCALLVEARWWTDLRWSFGERGYVRAWSLSIVLLALGTTWFWFTGEGRIHLFDVFMWLPVYLLPMILAQQYGTAARIPLNTFSFIARRRVHLDRQAGRPVRPIRVNIGYAYFGGVVMASAVMKGGSDSEEFVARWWFFGGSLLLVGLALLAVSPFSWKRPVAWAFALMLVAVASFATTAGLLGLYALLQEQMTGRTLGPPLASHSRTAIGTVGEIKLSDEIYWRAKGDVPALLRETVYNRYQVGRWAHMPPVGLNRYDDFEEAVLGLVGEDGKQFAFRREDLGLKPEESRVVTLRGASQQLTPLPLPAGTRVLERVKADGLFFNSLGTVLADNPDYSVLDFSARYQQGATFDLPPTGHDLQIPPDEADAVERVCAGLDLYRRSDRDKLKVVRSHFLREFQYTLYAGRAGGTSGGRRRNEREERIDSEEAARRAVGVFLEQTRAGHCEYFATGAALLLRQAGLPVRYCLGFSARQEYDESREEWVLRGRHAHSWCRVYVDGTPSETVLADGSRGTAWTGGRWVDFDATPPNWTIVEGGRLPWQQRVSDWVQRLREDFLLWRTRPENIARVSWGTGIIGALLLIYVAVRLWLSRTRTGSRRKRTSRRGVSAGAITPFHTLAKRAEKWLGSRPDGLAQTRWLMQLTGPLPDLELDLRHAVHLHWKARYDPLGLEAADQERLREVCRKLAQGMKRARR